MQLEQLTEMARTFMEGLPAPVMDALGDVELMIADDVNKVAALLKEELGDDFDPKELTSDLKGVFVGSPMEIEESDANDNSEEEVVYFPEGFVVLLADNIDSAEEGALVLMHEIGHALDMDEDEVKNLGLGVGEKAKGDDGNQSVGQ